MYVNAAELNQMKTLVHTQRSISLLGEFPEKSDIIARLKAAKKVWWGTTRVKYSIPKDVPLSVELDGLGAGELRVKGTGDAYMPAPMDDCPGCSACDEDSDSPEAANVTADQIASVLNQVFRGLGVSVIANS